MESLIFRVTESTGYSRALTNMVESQAVSKMKIISLSAQIKSNIDAVS